MTRNRLSTFICISGLMATGFSAQAENPASYIELKPVAELYTSQSCPRCPKGNERFSEFVEANDVIGLSFGVDYWDYMGWKDTVAHPDFTARQKALNEKMGRRGPYTPQVIMNGDNHCSATKEKGMKSNYSEAVTEASIEASQLKVKYDGQRLTIAAQDKPLEVVKVNYTPGQVYETPQEGQNRNKTMMYHNLATGIEAVGDVHPNQKTSLNTNCEKDCVFIFQEADMGPVIGGFYFSNAAPHS